MRSSALEAIEHRAWHDAEAKWEDAEAKWDELQDWETQRDRWEGSGIARVVVAETLRDAGVNVSESEDECSSDASSTSSKDRDGNSEANIQGAMMRNALANNIMYASESEDSVESTGANDTGDCGTAQEAKRCRAGAGAELANGSASEDFAYSSDCEHLHVTDESSVRERLSERRERAGAENISYEFADADAPTVREEAEAELEAELISGVSRSWVTSAEAAANARLARLATEGSMSDVQARLQGWRGAAAAAAIATAASLSVDAASGGERARAQEQAYFNAVREGGVEGALAFAAAVRQSEGERWHDGADGGHDGPGDGGGSDEISAGLGQRRSRRQQQELQQRLEAELATLPGLHAGSASVEELRHILHESAALTSAHSSPVAPSRSLGSAQSSPLAQDRLLDLENVGLESPRRECLSQSQYNLLPITTYKQRHSGTDRDINSALDKDTSNDAGDNGAGTTTQSDACAVCLESLSIGQRCHRLPCTHDFHEACLRKWVLNFSAACPICRFDLVASVERDGPVTVTL
eukprot:g2220.t1